jgi:hypothetical protein
MVAVAEESRTDIILLEVEDHAHDAARELEEFAGHGPIEAVDASNAVPDGDDGSSLADFDFATEILNLFLDYCADFFCPDFHKTISPLL